MVCAFDIILWYFFPVYDRRYSWIFHDIPTSWRPENHQVELPMVPVSLQALQGCRPAKHRRSPCRLGDFLDRQQISAGVDYRSIKPCDLSYHIWMLLLWWLHIGTVVVFCNHNSLFLWSRNTWFTVMFFLEGNPCEPNMCPGSCYLQEMPIHLFIKHQHVDFHPQTSPFRICWSIMIYYDLLNLLDFLWAKAAFFCWMYQARIVVQWTEKCWSRSGEGEIFTKSTTCCTWSSAGSAGCGQLCCGQNICKMDIILSTSILMVPHDPTVYRCLRLFNIAMV